MGVEKIKAAAGVGDNRDQQLMPDPLPTMALGDIQMADATGPRLLAKRVDVKPAHAHQLPVRKSPQQLFSRRVKTVFPFCQFSARRRSMFRFCARLSARSAEKPGSSGVTAAINNGAIIFLRQVSL